MVASEIIEETVMLTTAWLSDTIKAMVDDEDAVFVSVVLDKFEVYFTVKVNPADLGKVIGGSGRSARALRTLLTARGGKDGVRYRLDLDEGPRLVIPPGSLDGKKFNVQISGTFRPGKL